MADEKKDIIHAPEGTTTIDALRTLANEILVHINTLYSNISLPYELLVARTINRFSHSWPFIGYLIGAIGIGTGSGLLIEYHTSNIVSITGGAFGMTVGGIGAAAVFEMVNWAALEIRNSVKYHYSSLQTIQQNNPNLTPSIQAVIQDFMLLLNTVIDRYSNEGNPDNISPDLIKTIQTMMEKGIASLTLSEIAHISEQLIEHYENVQKFGDRSQKKWFKLPTIQPIDYHKHPLAPAATVNEGDHYVALEDQDDEKEKKEEKEEKEQKKQKPKETVSREEVVVVEMEGQEEAPHHP